MSIRYQIWTTECLYSHRGDVPEILVKPLPKKAKRSTSGGRESLKNAFAWAPWWVSTTTTISLQVHYPRESHKTDCSLPNAEAISASTKLSETSIITGLRKHTCYFFRGRGIVWFIHMFFISQYNSLFWVLGEAPAISFTCLFGHQQRIMENYLNKNIASRWHPKGLENLLNQ